MFKYFEPTTRRCKGENLPIGLENEQSLKDILQELGHGTTRLRARLSQLVHEAEQQGAKGDPPTLLLSPFCSSKQRGCRINIYVKRSSNVKSSSNESKMYLLNTSETRNTIALITRQ